MSSSNSPIRALQTLSTSLPLSQVASCNARPYQRQSSYTTLLNQIQHPGIYLNNQESNNFALLDGVALDYWTSSGGNYRDDNGILTPDVTSNPVSIWDVGTQEGGFTMLAPPGNGDTQYQHLTVHQSNIAVNLTDGVGGAVALKLVGEFDPNKLPGFNPLSAVPLETYYPLCDRRHRRIA